MMNVIEAYIPDLLEIELKVFSDKRGYFYESYNKEAFKQVNIDVSFVQDNQSYSRKGVLRGLHYQNPPYAQGKLARVIQGSVLDIAVDIRWGSPTYGQYHKVILSEENKKMLWMPEGFAHGFLTLEDDTVFFYKCTNFYHKESEGSIRYNDPEIGIEWGIENPILSEKDKIAPFLKSLKFNNFVSCTSY